MYYKRRFLLLQLAAVVLLWPAASTAAGDDWTVSYTKINSACKSKNYREAAKVTSGMLKKKIKKLGKKDILVAESLGVMGELYAFIGKKKKAAGYEARSQKLIVANRKSYSSGGTFQFDGLISKCLEENRDIQAIPYIKWRLSRLMDYDKEDSDTAKTMGWLALAYWHLEQLDMAESWYRRAAAIFDRRIEKSKERKSASAPVILSRKMVVTLIPNFGTINAIDLKPKTVFNGLRIISFINSYRRTNGAYPESLSALASVSGGALPADPFSGKDFKYRREKDGYVLYSLGMDEEDSGGEKHYDIVISPPR